MNKSIRLKHVAVVILVIISGILINQARAEELFGCKVKLCLAAVASQRPSECDPVLSALNNLLKNGDPFPKCDDARDGSYGRTFYEVCPKPLKAVGGLITDKKNILYNGIGTGDGIRRERQGERFKKLANKICADKQIGEKKMKIGERCDDDQCYPIYEYVPLFNRVLVIRPFRQAKKYTDIYISGKKYRRAYWR